jgi:enoyl-[acyl-carrier-protein] reductase (NADH)
LYEKSGINTDRLYEFLEKNITSKYKKKLIILDNASSHRSERIKELVNKHNKLLYSVPYQHFTNSIENFFSMLKSKLQKLDGLTHEEIKKSLKDILIESYVNIFKGAYDRSEKYVKTTKPRVKKTKNYLE